MLGAVVSEHLPKNGGGGRWLGSGNIDWSGLGCVPVLLHHCVPWFATFEGII